MTFDPFAGVQPVDMLNLKKPELMPSLRSTVFRDGTASLYHFATPEGVERPAQQLPVLLVPSMINRWYILDLRPGASMVEALLQAGLDVYLLDWGIPRDEDRYLEWDAVLKRLDRMVRRTLRHSGQERFAMLGYCMGGTLTAIDAALHPDRLAGLVSLTAPIDFEHAGLLGDLVDERWFDPEALTAAGNLTPEMMQSGFVAMRPTGQIAKWVSLASRYNNPGFQEAFGALEEWVGDNIPFPASAYVRYIRDLYQHNELARGQHYIAGRRVDLSDITSPLLTIAAERDTICPPAAASALNDQVSSSDQELLVVPGGHVGAVVGSRAPKSLYPAIAAWLEPRLRLDASRTLAQAGAGSLDPTLVDRDEQE